MREYKFRKDVQKKAYYSDRFYVTPSLQRKKVEDDKQFFEDFTSFSSKFEVQKAYLEHTHLVIYLDKNEIVEAMKFLKQELKYETLIELSAIDYVASKSVYEVFYELLSFSKHKRIRVKTSLQKDETLHSITEVFKAANWSEREMYDMFGIKIENHPNLKRLLMPDDWYDHPLKKTYPLQGDEVASWYEVDKIFGKEARQTIGEEQRDSAAIDRYDTTRFSRLGHEVPFDTDISQEEPDTKINYQEKGVSKILKKLNPEDSVVLKRRR